MKSTIPSQAVLALALAYQPDVEPAVLSDRLLALAPDLVPLLPQERGRMSFAAFERRRQNLLDALSCVALDVGLDCLLAAEPLPGLVLRRQLEADLYFGEAKFTLDANYEPCPIEGK